MAPYRNNAGRLADLIEHVKAIEDKNNTEHAIHRKAQVGIQARFTVSAC